MTKLMDLYLKAINEGSSLRFDSGARIEEVRAANTEETEQESESIDEAKKADRFHIVDQSGNPANLVSYGTLSSAMKDRDEKHPTAKIHLVGPRGKVKHVFEPKSVKEDFDQLDEISKETLGKYVQAASQDNYDTGKDVQWHRSEKEYTKKEKAQDRFKKRNKGIGKALARLTKEEVELDEEMTQAQIDKREKYVKGMKKNYKDFVSKYGARAKDVMYATATKMAMKEEAELDESAQHDPVAYRDSAMKAIRNKSFEAGNKASYMLGSNADRLGLSHKHNPYKPGTSSHKHWANGLEDSTMGVHRPPIGEEVDLNLEDFSLEEIQDFMMSEDFEQLDELKKSTLASYIRKAGSSLYKMGVDAADAFTDKEIKKSFKIGRKADNREQGIHRAVTKLAKEEVELDEANFATTMKKAIAAHERGDHARAKYHLDNAKTARYAMKSTEISKNKDLLDKYTELRKLHEEINLEEGMSGGERQAYRMGKKHGAVGVKKIDAEKSFGQHAHAYHSGYDAGKESAEWHATQADKAHKYGVYKEEKLDEIAKKALGAHIEKTKKAKIKFHNGEDDGHKGVTEEFGPVNEEITYFTEGMISHGDFMDKVDSYKKAGINVVSHKHTDNDAHIVTVDKEGTKRKINFKPSGTSMENLGKVEDGKKPKSADPEVKRGRGRPAGSKSGARTNGSDKKEYGGLAIHSLNLPKSK